MSLVLDYTTNHLHNLYMLGLINSAKRQIYAHFKKRDYLLIFIIFIFLVLLLNPLRNIPIDDDWAYFFSVKKLILEHKFIISDMTTPNLLSHALWGWLFSWFGGLSYTTLRISTLVLSFTAVYILDSQYGKKGLLANPALWLLFNPIFLLLS